MKNKIFLYLIILVTFIECGIKVNDFCHKIEIKGKKIECNGDRNLSCTKMTCSKDKYTCQKLKMLNFVKKAISKYDIFPASPILRANG